VATVPQDVLTRFFARVDKQSGLRGCWLWTGGKAARTGYGKIWVDGKQVSVHRFAYAALVGPIPAGFAVMHACDVRHCCNPDHLSLGTTAENMRDNAVKGRADRRPGERHPLARLTEAAVAEIKRLRDEDGLTFAAIAGRMGVTDSAVESAYHGRTWRHVS